MKRYSRLISAILIAALTVSLLAMAAFAAHPIIPVHFEMNGHGKAVPTQAVREGMPVKEPTEPTEANWCFTGWFTDEACTALYDFSAPVTAELTLFAKWEARANCLSYCNDDTVLESIGTLDDTPFYWAAAYDPADLTVHGKTFLLPAVSVGIEDVAYFASENSTLTIRLYQGETTDGEPIFTQTVTAGELKNGWNDIRLTTPVTVDCTKRLWVVFNATLDDTYVAAICKGTDDARGRLVSMDGINWYDMAEAFGFTDTFAVKLLLAAPAHAIGKTPVKTAELP